MQTHENADFRAVYSQKVRSCVPTHGSTEAARYVK